MLLSELLKMVAGRRDASLQASRLPGGLRTLELFSGAGLATEGLLAGGMDVVRCVEWDKDADATARGLGHPSLLGDVRISETTAGLGAVDLMWASTPCQAWSSAGKQLGADDPRNGFPWLLDAVDRVNPRWVMSENVPKLTHHKARCGRNGKDLSCAGCYWDSIVNAFKRRFAHVSWKILNAADYGAPQARERVFMVAGPTAVAWPEPTHADPKLKGGSGLPRWRTVRDVLDVPGLDGWMSETNHSAADYRVVKSLDLPINTLAAGSEDAHAGCGFALTFGYPVGSTVPVGVPRLKDSDMDARGFPRHKGVRRLSVDETALLMGMPSGIDWRGSIVHQRQQIGNGCCPQVVEALARSLGATDAAYRARGSRSGRMPSGSRFVAQADRGLDMGVLKGDPMTAQNVESLPSPARTLAKSLIRVWSVRVGTGRDQQAALEGIEQAGGSHFDWFGWEYEDGSTDAASGTWSFLIPRDRLPSLHRAGWIHASL